MNRRLLIIAFGILTYLQGQTTLATICLLSETEVTQGLLEDYFNALNNRKAECGRYPTSGEGLDSLAKAPDPKCIGHSANASKVTGTMDGWNLPLKYVSDGVSFQIAASHGYFVSDNSPINRFGSHWQNADGAENKPSPKELNHRRANRMRLFFLSIGILILLSRLFLSKYLPKPIRKWSDIVMVILTLISISLASMDFFFKIC